MKSGKGRGNDRRFRRMGGRFASFARPVIDLPGARLAKFQTRSKTTACSPPILQIEDC